MREYCCGTATAKTRRRQSSSRSMAIAKRRAYISVFFLRTTPHIILLCIFLTSRCSRYVRSQFDINTSMLLHVCVCVCCIILSLFIFVSIAAWRLFLHSLITIYFSVPMAMFPGCVHKYCHTVPSRTQWLWAHSTRSQYDTKRSNRNARRSSHCERCSMHTTTIIPSTVHVVRDRRVCGLFSAQLTSSNRKNTIFNIAFICIERNNKR